MFLKKHFAKSRFFLHRPFHPYIFGMFSIGSTVVCQRLLRMGLVANDRELCAFLSAKLKGQLGDEVIPCLVDECPGVGHWPT